MGLFDNLSNSSDSSDYSSGLFNGNLSGNNNLFSFDPTGSQYTGSSGNSSANQVSYSSPTVPQLNSTDAYDQSLKYNQFAGDQAAGQSQAASQFASQLGLQTKAAAANIDSNTKLNDATNAANVANNAQSNSSTGGDAFGAGAAPPSTYNQDLTGYGAAQGLYNASNQADWQDRQNAALNSIGAASKQSVQGQMALAQQQQQYNQQNQAANAVAQYNQGQTQQNLANINAQSSLLSAMLNRPQHNYWS